MTKTITPLRQRMIDDMTLHNLTPSTQKVYTYAIANLAKGRLVDAPSSYAGALLIGVLKTAVMARAAMPPAQRHVFQVIIGELQLFGTELIASLFSAARKYNLTFTTANQDTHQLCPAVRTAVLANAGIIAVFRPSHEDAELSARRFQMDAAGLLELMPRHMLRDGLFAGIYALSPKPGARRQGQAAECQPLWPRASHCRASSCRRDRAGPQTIAITSRLVPSLQYWLRG